MDIADKDLLNINLYLHGRGTIEFKPQISIVTWEYIYKLTDWIENRYTNINGRSFLFRNNALDEYADPMKVSYSFMVSEFPPNILCSDIYKVYPDIVKFNGYNNEVNINGFEMLYYIAQELNILHLFEYSNNFIKIILSK